MSDNFKIDDIVSTTMREKKAIDRWRPSGSIRTLLGELSDDSTLEQIAAVVDLLTCLQRLAR